MDLNTNVGFSKCLVRQGNNLLRCSTERDNISKRLLVDLATLGLPLETTRRWLSVKEVGRPPNGVASERQNNFSTHEIGPQLILLALDLD